MITALIVLFAAGYLLIALEHRIRIDKAAIALLMCAVLWTLYSTLSGDRRISSELVDHVGSTCEILIYLIGAMTIVDLIDMHGGFGFITGRIRTRSRRKLLWLLVLITFFMSGALDNMTTTIVMVMLLRRLVADREQRWIYASAIVIAANSGGAWSPIGDVTTIMLWIGGNVTALPLMRTLLLPCLASTVIPTLLITRMLPKGKLAAVATAAPKAMRLHCRTRPDTDAHPMPTCIDRSAQLLILVAGIASLLFVPIFKGLTGLPPFMGMILSLAAMWLLTEWLYARKRCKGGSVEYRVPAVLRQIDMPTILFFLGILMAVAALESAGVLTDFARTLDRSIHEVYAITSLTGLLSSVVDNVPLVAACMGMYPVADSAAVAASSDPAFMRSFMQDGSFWNLLTYCAGIGGSLLIIGSAAGVVAMGLEKIRFGWYAKRITLPALAGYLAGIALIRLEYLIF